MSTIEFPVLYIPDPDKGRPLFNGQIYIGKPDLDPTITANQKDVFYIQEDGSLIAASQPIQLSAGGVPTYNGSSVTLDVDGSYSMKVLDKNGAQAYYVASTNTSSSSSVLAEQQVQLSSGQTTVVFSAVFVDSAKIYIGSADVDRGRLFRGIDYNIVDYRTIELTSSFPDGSYCVADGVASPVIQSEVVAIIPTVSRAVFSNVANMQAGLTIGGSTIEITGLTACETLGFNSAGDGGKGFYRGTGSVSVGAAGDVDVISGDIYADNGIQLRVESVNGRVTSSSMGLIPDGVTDYFVDGRMDRWLQYLSNNDVTGVFTAGDYNCGIDQLYSNISIYGEPGAVFAATIHIAINSDLNQPTLNRAKNVRWMGEAASYIRVGSWNCDDVYIERIAIYEDPTKAQSGFRAGGVHFFGGSKDMYIGDCYVQNSERSAAVAVDYEPGQTSPENVHFENIFIESSYVHGVSFVGDNITFGKIAVKEYGMGNVTDPLINFALSQNPGGLIQAMGFSLGSFGSCSGDSLTVSQNPLSVAGIGSAVNLFTAGTFECDSVVVDGALNIGFQNNFTDATVNKLVVKNGTARGVFNKAKLSGSDLTVDGNSEAGIRNEQGGLISYGSIITKNNGLEGYDSGDGIIVCNRMLCEGNNTQLTGYGCKIGTTSAGNIGLLEIKQASSGVGGGVEFTGVLQKFSVGTINTENSSKDAGNFASVSMNGANGLVHYGGGLLTGDDGVLSGQPLRITGPTDISLNGLIINDSFNGNGIAGIITLTDRVGFMNCKNSATTNISPITVTEFNCSGMTL